MKLYVTVDFHDELCSAAWTPQMLSEYFYLMKEKGISRIYWIDQKEIMMHSGIKARTERMLRTWDNFKGDIHSGAVKAAHAAGLEIFALIKPYEMGLLMPSSDHAEKSDGIDVVGGKILSFLHFAREHQEIMIHREDFSTCGEIETFILSFNKPLTTDAPFKVYGSNTNADYQIVSEEILLSGTESVKIPRKEFLYYVFVLEDSDAGNTLRSLVTAEDAQGRTAPVTLALCPKQRVGVEEGFRSLGMLFDYVPGIPSVIFSPEQIERREFHFNAAKEHALGVTLELNPVIAGNPDPQHPLFHQFIQEWVREDLNYGFDGIEIRISSHNSPIFWSEYGSGQKVRRQRGEAHTRLLRKLSECTREARKKFSIHIEDFMYGCSLEQSCPMECFWDYHTWIREKVCDEVTSKIIRTKGFSPENLEMISLCREMNIPVNICPFLHGCPEVDKFARQAKFAGAEAFNIYEAATLWRYEDGRFTERNPQQAQLLWSIPGL